MVTYPICTHCDQPMRRPNQPKSEHPGTVRIASQTCCGRCRKRLNYAEFADRARRAPSASVATARNWRVNAACRDVDREVFFPAARPDTHTLKYGAAKVVCNGCPVSKQCLDSIMSLERGLGSEDRAGMFASLKPGQRAHLDPLATIGHGRSRAA